jgi:hypothetical protein
MYIYIGRHVLSLRMLHKSQEGETDKRIIIIGPMGHMEQHSIPIGRFMALMDFAIRIIGELAPQSQTGSRLRPIVNYGGKSYDSCRDIRDFCRDFAFPGNIPTSMKFGGSPPPPCSGLYGHIFYAQF